MDRTVLTLAVDSTQVGTAAAAFERLTNTGNAAAASGSKVAATILAQGRAFGQNLVPAINRSAEGMRTLADTQRTLSLDATRQVAMRYTPVRPRDAGNTPAAAPSFASGASPAIQSATTGRAAPTALPGVGAGLSQVPPMASAAQGAIDRLTTSTRSNRAALLQLSPAAEAAARTLRQLNATLAQQATPKAVSSAASVLAAASRANPMAAQSVAAAFAAIAAQATRAAAAVGQANRVIGAAPRGGLTMTGSAPRAPLAASQIVSAATGQRVPTANFSTSEMTVEAGRAQSAIERLTSAARDQRSALAQLAATTGDTAGAYRQLSAAPTLLNPLPAANRNFGQPRPVPSAAGQGRPVPGSGGQGGRPPAQNGAQGDDLRVSAAQMQQISFQLNDFFVQVASGGSALTALIQQGSQLSGTFGGVRPAFQAVLSLLTPMRIAAGAAATAISTLAVAYQNAAAESRSFKDAAALTGNFAGQTEGQFNALARSVANGSQSTVASAREMAQALLATGQIGPQVFDKTTEAAVRFGAAFGKSASETADVFQKMADSPSRFAAELNKTMNLWDAAAIKAISDAEDGEDAWKAQLLVLDKLIPRLQSLDQNLDGVDRALVKGKKAWADWWEGVKGYAGDVTGLSSVGRTIERINDEIARANGSSNGFASAKSGGMPASRSNVPELESQLQDQLAGEQVKQASAFNEAASREANKKAISANDSIKRLLKQAKADSLFKEEQEKLEIQFKDAEYGGTPVSEAEKKLARAQLKKNFTPAKGRGDSEASQVLAQQLQGDLRSIGAIFQKQRDAYEFQSAFVEASYRNGTLSLSTLMQQRREALEGASKAELESLDKEAARLQAYLKQVKDPSERTQTKAQLEEVSIRREQVDLQGQRDLVMLNEEEAQSLRALSEQVINYRANLLELAGDEAGAAAARAQTIIANAKLLQAQSGGQISDKDVSDLAQRTATLNQFNEVQRQASLLAGNSARAEEAFALAAEQSGKSLLETERGIFALRSEELSQLGALTQKAKELAEVSTDPRLKAFAADLSLSYAKAVNAIDPALNRLRDAQRELAGGLANTAGGAPSAFIQAYASQRQASSDDVKRQKDEYSRKIDMLEGYLATTQDKSDKARLRERIKAEEAKRDGVKGESRGKSVLGAINDAVVQPMAKQVFETVNKLLITNPLETYLKAQLGHLTEGNGALAGVFKDALGIKADPKQMAQQQQTAAITASSSALDVLTVAAQNAAAALGQRSPASAALAAAGQEPADRQRAILDPSQPPPIDSALAGAQDEAADSALQFGQQAATATSDLARLASAAGVGGNAMAQLPTIVSLFQSAVAAMSTSGSSGSAGGIFSAIASMFSKGGSGGGVASASDYASFDFLAAATGGYISGPGTGTSDSIPARLSNGEYVMPAAQTKLFRPVLEQMREGSIFEKAPKYHTGGIVGKVADKARAAGGAFAAHLKQGEIPAILMKNEEVLRADDPRHRDNLGESVVARILHGGGRRENSATVLQGLLERLGVKDDDESAASKAFKVHAVRGARELGGPVSAGGMYRVNERGPELLQVAGKQYLMTGNQGGNVVPNGGGGKEERPLVVHNNFTLAQPASRATQGQVAASAAQGLRRAAARNL